MSGWAKRLLESRFRIATQLYLGLGAAVSLTIVATLVGWFSFDRVSDLQSRVNEGSVPEMAAAFEVARLSGTLVAAAPRLTTAPTSEDFTQVAAGVAEDRQAFEDAVDALMQRDADEERFARIRDRGDALIANLEAIEGSVGERFLLRVRSEALLAEVAALQKALDDLLVPAIDDQLFYAMTGYQALGAPPTPRDRHLSEAEFARYRHLAGLQANATIAIQLLTGAFNISDAPLLEPLRERFESATGKIERSLSVVAVGALRDRLEPGFARLVELGLGQGFDLRAREITLAARQGALLARNRDLAIELVAEAESLVDSAGGSAREATRASTQAILTGRNLLLALSVISVVGAVLIAWLFIGRVLLRRLARLSERMRRMAGGDLEAEVDIRGRDEVSDMAAALEVFRRHALEVQRLNLVEKLADELKGKNAQLEDALANLHRAQDQIVMREKLAALGELTAGVAHEIRNPLNFVKNFSEVSEELLEELLEELQAAREKSGETGEKEDEERRALIDEIAGDLTGNLKRIREHGERANQIVQHMLAMGRGSGERQPTDINALLDEHARLAYHSARANDPNFQLRIEQDLDPALGELDVVAQDLGRVFLNMVGNACYAIDERRRAAEAEDGGDGERYEPVVTLATKRQAENVEVRIRDNGSGIPPDVVDKIFNPFFTTKPTDQGTGLGLALSSDIVRQHGGEIRVESEPGAFTEMIVVLPLTPPAASADDEEDTAEGAVSADSEGE